ncbi:hypothetical protein [Streptomyces bluensis]|uniref:Uncharacterized protein n=1 Tax=Streptomyces bluensis TaxID=33897 RepID=A0ABW6U9E0_9ACTN|nr:hypothetical protein [Streptomyces bluensis]GGZ88642.1 hypothetical protein GCM10010344_65300 [Streptomyces bluensis]
MADETGGPGTRDRAAHQDDRQDRGAHRHDPREMPERHGTQEEPRRSYDPCHDERDLDIREGYR